MNSGRIIHITISQHDFNTVNGSTGNTKINESISFANAIKLAALNKQVKLPETSGDIFIRRDERYI